MGNPGRQPFIEEEQMKNIKIERKGAILTIEIDTSKRHGPSQSGKSQIIASTEGNVKLEDGIQLGVNCYVKT